jgi:aerobic carbon-monoxide dehydrogenase large subunit
MKFGMGQSVKRSEDVRFVTGNGQYTDDITLPEQAYAYVLRSPHAHAKVLSVDPSPAKTAAGVIAVLTFPDIERMGAGRMPCLAPVAGKGGAKFKESPMPLLAESRVTFVGQPVAMVVAETLAQARDASELINVEYDPLPGVGTVEKAKAPGAPQIWPDAPGNLVLDWESGDQAKTDAAFGSAPHIVSVAVVQNRVVANPMETRAALGSYDAKADRYLLHTCGQGTTMMHRALSRFLLKVPIEKLRIIQPDVGGGFGMKGFMYPEQALVLFAARATGRPVKWTAERSESFLADAHGRDMQTHVELALDKAGAILGLRVIGTANLGGYLSQYAPFIPTQAGSRVFGGLYRIPAVYTNIAMYFTNTAPVDAYRGAGRPEAAYFMERLMDLAAAKVGVDRIEIRRRNLLKPNDLPYKSWSGLNFDSGDPEKNIGDALKRADWDGFESRKGASKAKGKLRGRGIAYYVEITASGAEPAAIRFTDNGGVEVFVGTLSNGQGHETSFAQIIAEKLGVPFESITIKQGDSDFPVAGGGTGGSRSLHMAGGAMLAASDEVIRKGKIAAGHLLEAAASDIEFEVSDAGGRFAIAGTDRSLSIGEVAIGAKKRPIPGLEGGLDVSASYKGESSTFPNGCHICEVEVDGETGKVDLVSYSVVDDFGRVINPMLVAGQVHGGVAQGIGQALLEHCVYEPETGQLMTGSFMDYGMPRADDLPTIDFSYNEFPTKTNPLGSKGCGEAGTVGAMPSVIGAICDALGVAHIDMPATPEKVWRVLSGRSAH